MSLDQNLFTLIVTPNADDPNVIDLVDPQGTIHYRKQRLPGSTYTVQVYDYLSQSLLLTASAPSRTSKTKILELCNPTKAVELRYTGTLSFKWQFKWEEHDFEWKREECYLIRKPDPPVLVAITKEPPGRIKTTSVQILDYNLHRFDIDDRKGLEIVMLSALLTFQDANEEYHNTNSNGVLGALRRTSVHAAAALPTTRSISPPPPVPPPKPEPRTGVDRIAETHAIRGDVNEVTVEEEGAVRDYAVYCANLLQDDAMLFVTVASASEEQVPKVIQVVEEAKRILHRAGQSDELELHQYVLYDTIKPKGPRVIKLDDTAANKYRPPSSLIIHLSKIPMPELQPKASKPSESSTLPQAAERKEDTSKKGKRVQSVTPPKPPKRLVNKPRSPSPTRVHSHQVHPNQPSPSPAQLNNPFIYTSEPPPPFPSHEGGSSTQPSLYGSHAPPLYSPSEERRPSNSRNGIWDFVAGRRG